MTPLGGPVEEDDLHARIDGQLPRERAEDVEAYLAAHPEEQKRFAQYAAQRDALRSAFSSQAYGPIPNRLRVAHLLAQLRRGDDVSPWRSTRAKRRTSCSGCRSDWADHS